MDMSPYDSLKGFKEVCVALCRVLLEHSAGLTVNELRDIVKQAHRIDLEDIRKDLGFGNLNSFLTNLPGCQLIHPEQHGNCRVKYVPAAGHADTTDAANRSEEKCWIEDIFPDSFLPCSSPTPQHKPSPEILETSQPQKPITPQTPHHKAPTTTEKHKTAAQPAASMSPVGRHSGSQNDHQHVPSDQSRPVSTSPDSICISKPTSHPQRNSVTAPSGENQQRRPPGLDEVILHVLTQPMFASGLRVPKLIELLSRKRGIDLDDLSWRLGYQDVFDLLQQVPNVKLLDPSKGENCVIRLQPELICFLHTGHVDSFDATNRSEEKCWFEDSFTDEILDTGQPQRPTPPPATHLKVPTTTETHNTAAQPATSRSAAGPQSGFQGGPTGVHPGQSLPVPASAPDSTCNSKPPVLAQRNSATAPSGANQQRLPPGLDEEILHVLTEPMFASGLRVPKLIELLSRKRGIDLYDLSWRLGYQDVFDLLKQVRNIKLQDPSKGENCVIRLQPGHPDSCDAINRSEEKYWFEDNFHDSFRSSCSPIPQHTFSPEILDTGQPQRPTPPQTPHQKVPTTTEMHISAAQPASSMSPAGPHSGHVDSSDTTNRSEEKCWFEDTFPDSFLSSSTPSPQHNLSPEILDTDQTQRPTTPQTPHHKALTTSETHNTAAQPSASMSPVGPHSGPQDGPQGVHPGHSLPIPTSALDSTCRSKPTELPQRNSPSGANHQKRPSGLDEEILSIVTQPMFASGLRVLKLIDLLIHERGIDLDDLSWGLGYQDVLDLLQQVPNVKLLDPSKGENCVIKYQPGSGRNRGPLLPRPMGPAAIYSSNHCLRTESGNLPYNSTSHAFLYPVPHHFPQKQNRTYYSSKHFSSNAPWFPSQKTKSAAVYISKNHQNPGPTEQNRKQGMTLVFRASKTPASAGILQNGPPMKTLSVQDVSNMSTQETFVGPLKVYPTPAHPNGIPQIQKTFQMIPNHMASRPSEEASSEDYGPVKDLDPILKDEILVVLLQQPHGVGFGEFAGLFHRTHGYQFKLCRHGFTSLRELLNEMTDLVDVTLDPLDPLIKCKGRHHYVFIGGGSFSSQIRIL